MKTQTRQFLPSVADLAKTKNSPDYFHLMFEHVSDAEIVERVKSDKKYFSYIVERYDWKLKKYVKRITGVSQESVEDIVQEVFMKVYVNIDKFDQNFKFSSWIYRIAHNQAVNRYVYEKHRKTESITTSEGGEAHFITKDENDIWERIQQDDINENLHVALKEIAEKYQEVIEMSYFQEKSYQEIATELKKPINTVGTTLSRGKKLLEKELERIGISRDIALA